MSEKKEIIPFIYDESPIRVIMDEKQNPWFVGKDVCRALELSDHHQALDILDDDEKGLVKVPTHRGMQSANCITEHGLYTLIFRSNKPNAKTFRRWVTHEVLPALRRTGQYAINEKLFADNQTTFKELMQILGRVAKVVERLEKRLDLLDDINMRARQGDAYSRKIPDPDTAAFYERRKAQLDSVRDDVRRFLVERTIVNPDSGTLLTWMYVMYEQWCFSNCMIPLGRVHFYTECRKALAGYGEIRAARGNKLYVSGLRLRDDKDLYPSE